jgi:hypothetical protein
MPWNKIGLAFLAFTLTGCASTTPALDATSPQFGNAIAQNIAAQRVAPSAEDKANTFIPPNRARQKAAQEAYENGTVAEPTLVDTTE